MTKQYVVMYEEGENEIYNTLEEAKKSIWSISDYDGSIGYHEGFQAIMVHDDYKNAEFIYRTDDAEEEILNQEYIDHDWKEHKQTLREVL